MAAADRLVEIPGVSRKLAMAVIAETGLDMTRFPTADHLVSWAASPSAPRSVWQPPTAASGGGTTHRA